MLKRGMCFALTCLMVMSMAACGGGGETAPETSSLIAATETTSAPVETTVVTEPTLSEEERLIASLPEKVRQAYDLGLVELELLKDIDRVCLGAEAAQIVQNIHVAHYGVESKIMNQLLEHDHASIEVTRFWLAHTMFLAEAEVIEEAPYDNYMENYKYMMEAFVDEAGFNEMYTYFINSDGETVIINDEDWIWYRDYEHGAVVSTSISFICDLQEIFVMEELVDQQELYVNCTDLHPEAVSWASMAYDKLTGEKIMTANEDIPFLPRQTMTVREVVETTLRYNNWIPPQDEVLPYEELPAYDPTIITEDLLAKQTTLPEVSCQNLPESWRGITSEVLVREDSRKALADRMLQENEIQVIADAGFNFLQLHLDFKYYSSDDIMRWPGWAKDPKYGYMNETRLKEIDRIIAYCMKHDIHVNLVCDGYAGWDPSYPPPFSNTQKAAMLGRQWAVFAQRYADIPNTYLSFTLHNEPEIWVPGQYGKFFTPVVEAIREVSPDRCIIADIGGRGDPGEDMAALGVALSTKAYWPEEFHMKENLKAEDRTVLFESASWPYESNGKVYDAQAAMTNKRWNCDTPDAVAAVAEEYGVGFMVSGWSPTNYPSPVFRERFTDAFMESYLTDFVSVLSDRGYGWCYGDHNGFMGLFGAYPAVESTTYTQVGNAPLYIDDEMFAWFQKLNGVVS